MHLPHARPRRSTTALVAAVAVSLVLASCSAAENSGDSGDPEGKPATAEVTPPPVHGGFDYQLGGAYPPPAGTSIVVRDHTASPAPGTYSICYVNAFQAQPDAEGEWDDDLLLRDADGEVVVDPDWDEALLDIRTAAKRDRVARKVNAWIDTCADKGFDAVEPDNYDTYTRAPDGLLTADDAKAFLTLLAGHAHAEGLAVAQKNTPDLAADREEVGLDFAVAEECGRYDECDAYTDAFGRHVVDVEYEERGMERACAGWGDEISVVLRDRDVVPRDDSGYVRETCDSL
ncbi:endo alpha-1,4 polygalactosaminidase [Streptomyces sp. NPDC003247]|uniref:endo alpha-1,4 polygalactosaminidase n=1 Tax=Streptomyces sp. NPDC003247 TaxID=3364677 RepID=UPI0036CECAC8